MPVLVIQMGHAGRTSGATGAPGEQAYTQAVGGACARLLHGVGGWAVRLIGADPPSTQYRGDAFVAVHADGSTSPAVRGASVGYQNNPGADLAHAWRAAYVRRGFTGPWHPDNYTTNLAQYYGVSTARAQGNLRACIIECGTITSPEDRALMAPDRVALAIGDALGITTQEADVTPEELLDYSLDGGTPSSAFHVINTELRPALTKLSAEVDAVASEIAALSAKIDELFGSGLVLRPAGEITVRAEQP